MAHDTTLIQHPPSDSKPSYTSDSSPPTDTDSMSAVTEATDPNDSLNPPIEWDWDAEHADREKERKADATMMHMHNGPFQVDRKLLKDVVREKMECEVGRIQFLSSGTFHKAYLITLSDRREVIARVARRFMPRLKTESEVATMSYIRTHTSIPVPQVYFYDSNPYNRLGGEYIIMSKAKGVPLSTVFHSMPHETLVALLSNLASLVIPLFAHRFSNIGSLYFGPPPEGSEVPPPSAWSSSAPTPTLHNINFKLPTTTTRPSVTPRDSSATLQQPQHQQEYHVGQIISWPFFGSNRGDLAHPTEIDRGPWSSSHAYFLACAQREINGVILENEGKAAPHRLHLDPDEIRASRHHHLQAVPDDRSDESDEYDWEESEEEWEGPGDAIYRDYRRMQRSTFLIAHLSQREEVVRREMGRWVRMMETLSRGVQFGHAYTGEDPGGGLGQGQEREEFGLDCHDLSLENIFVDPGDHSKITCVIDWESTTIRPLWACAHPPAFLQSSPFTARLFREAVSQLLDRLPPSPPSLTHTHTTTHSSREHLATLVAEWRHYETAGAPLRLAHRCVEWDGWEEGLVESILGPEDQEEGWIREVRREVDSFVRTSWSAIGSPNPDALTGMTTAMGLGTAGIRSRHGVMGEDSSASDGEGEMSSASASGKNILRPGIRRKKSKSSKAHTPKKRAQGIAKMTALAAAEESQKERLLDGTGDICGGRGGELGRRLEALLRMNGNGDGSVRREVPGWTDGDAEEYDAGEE